MVAKEAQLIYYRGISTYTLENTELDILSLMASGMCEAAGCVPEGMFDSTVDVATVQGAKERTSESQSKWYFYTMCGYLTLSKPLTTSPDNSEYLVRRWKAFSASLYGKEENMEVTVAMKTNILKWQQVLGADVKKRRMFAQIILGSEYSGTEEYRNQILTVWSHTGQKSVEEMYTFTQVPRPVLAFEHVFTQAKQFTTAYRELREKYGSLYPYANVLGLSLSSLSHRTYPDLYYCAIKEGIRAGHFGREGRYIISDVTTKHPREALDKLMSLQLSGGKGLTMEEMKSKLEELGIKCTEESVQNAVEMINKRLNRQKRKRKHQSESEDSD